MKIKTGDKVLVKRGKNRGKTGKVSNVFPVEGKLIVEGVNIQKKHRRPRKQKEKGQVVEVAAPIYASNVKLICSSCNKATRIGYQREGKEKHRVCKKCGKNI